VGEPKYKVEDFVKTRNLNFTVLLDRESAVAEIYDLLGVPVYFVINSSGQIVSTGNHFPGDLLPKLAVKHSQ
jgi:peroxiredoxin